MAIYYGLEQQPQTPANITHSTALCPVFFLKDLTEEAETEKDLLKKLFKHSAEDPERNFGPFLKSYELSRKASLLQLGEGEDGCESNSGISQSINSDVFSPDNGKCN